MNLINIIKNLLNIQKKIDLKKLPSQGLFYKSDFQIIIKKANIEDINDYEKDFIKDNVGVIIYKVKKIVENNILLTNNYKFEDIKSIDIVFLFLEIVKFTKGKPIKVTYLNEEKNSQESVDFSSEYFNYYIISDKIMKKYNNELRCFEIDGYKFSLPTIGIENCLTKFLISKQNEKDSSKYNDYFYDFTYFLLNRREVEFDEIENLIQIFNFDIESDELRKINSILQIFTPMQKYSLIKNGKIIDINSRIDLEKIWK